MTGGGVSESLKIPFLEAAYGSRVSFLSLSIFSGYEFDVMAVSGTDCTFYYHNCFKNVGKNRDCCIYFELYL